MQEDRNFTQMIITVSRLIRRGNINKMKHIDLYVCGCMYISYLELLRIQTRELCTINFSLTKCFHFGHV